MSETKIYLDNAATSPVTDNVLNVMLPWLREGYGNASALYALGRKSAIALNKARAQCAELLGCEPGEIIFTSGGTESDVQAVCSAAENGRLSGKDHIITSAFEHHAVLNAVKEQEKRGFRVTYLPVYDNGIVRVSDLEAALDDKTALVTVMAVNNEVGTIQPVAGIGQLCRERGITFHTDAVQAFGNIPLNVREQSIDMLSISGHKLHAPKGVGLLYAKRSAGLRPLIVGGPQQYGKRAGTENIAGIAALAEAMRAAAEGIGAKNAKLMPLRERLIAELSALPGAKFNGDRERRVASNVNFSFPGQESETLILKLDLRGIAVSGGSACASGSLEPSHVLAALGCTRDEARGSLRVTMSDLTTEEDITAFIKAMYEIMT